MSGAEVTKDRLKSTLDWLKSQEQESRVKAIRIEARQEEIMAQLLQLKTALADLGFPSLADAEKEISRLRVEIEQALSALETAMKDQHEG